MIQNVPVLRPSEEAAEINRLIAGRWSSRAFNSDKPVESDVLQNLFEAARWAPSAMNNQPWRFLVFGPSDSEALDEARKSLAQGNSWALNAPYLLFILTRTDRPGSNKDNSRADYEAGMAAMAMAIQAAEEGLVFHQMAGFSAERIRTSFSVPENFRIIVAIALGYPGSVETVPEEKRDAETAVRTRRSRDNLVFADGRVPEE